MRELIQHLRSTLKDVNFLTEADIFKPASAKEVQKRKKDMPLRRFYFPLTLSGQGFTIEEAWEDAVDSFSQDPDGPTDNATAVRIDPDTFEEIGPEEKVT